MRVFPDKINIWVGGLPSSSVSGHYPVPRRLAQNQGLIWRRNCPFWSCLTVGAGMSPLVFSGAGTDTIGYSGSQDFGLRLNNIREFPVPPACRWQIVETSQPPYCKSQYRMINQSLSLPLSVSLSVCTYTYMVIDILWFCLSLELRLIQHFISFKFSHLLYEIDIILVSI